MKIGLPLLLACLVAAVSGQPAHAAEASNPLAVAYDCLARMAAYAQSGQQGDLRAAVKAGTRLVALRSTDADGRAGWAYAQEETRATAKCGQAGSLDAFGDGTCNPPETPYMIQTGYALACLAQLSIATGDRQFLDPAIKAAKDSWGLGTVPTGCPGCFYYWYSYHANDRGRYVRNTNVIMGLGLAWLHAATGDAAFKSRASAVAEAERQEMRQGNLGYFGVNDPRYAKSPGKESRYVNNHMPHQVKALKDMALVLGRPELLKDASSLLGAFMDCRSEFCRPNDCGRWAAPASCKTTMTIAPCILSDVDSRFASQCSAAREAIGRLNGFQNFASAPGDAVKSLAKRR